MKMKLDSFELRTKNEFDMINITERVHKFVEESGVNEGMVYVMTAHTTTSIIVNESLPCLETDIEEKLEEMVPKDAQYAHNHFLPSYGATGGNCPGHLKSMLCNYFAYFPVKEGKVVRGRAQEIYFAEFDGIQDRTVYMQVVGE